MQKYYCEKVGLSGNKTTAVISVLKLQNDSECYKKIQIGRSPFNRYSEKAIDRIQQALEERSIDDIWQEYKSKLVIYRRKRK